MSKKHLKAVKSKYRIFIGIPSSDNWNADFAISLINMQSHLFQHVPDGGCELYLSNYRSSLLQDSRQQLANHAVKKDATHLLFLDADMTFPYDTINRLLAHKLPMVCANYVKRVVPATTNTIGLDGCPVFSTPDKTGLEEVISAGFGVSLFDVDIFRKMSKPYFDIVWMDNEQIVGEDVFFFRKVKYELGHSLYIDHDLSHEVGHIGTFEYLNSMAEITDTYIRNLDETGTENG